MKNNLIICMLFLLLTACIGDDVIFDTVPEAVRITASVDTLGVGDSFQFEALFTNAVGLEEMRSISWTSSTPEVVAIDNSGLATGISAGAATIRVEIQADEGLVNDEFNVMVGAETSAPSVSVLGGTVETTSSYLLEGSFTLEQNGSDLGLQFAEDYKASTALPGLYVYLSNNPNSVSGAYEIGEVTVFSGAHGYQISGVDLLDYSYVLYYCKPFNVKVGDGKIEE